MDFYILLKIDLVPTGLETIFTNSKQNNLPSLLLLSLSLSITDARKVMWTIFLLPYLTYNPVR